MGNFNYAYGWKKQIPDFRDIPLKIQEFATVELPSKVDLTPLCPPVYNQGNLGSCVDNAIASAYQFDLMKQGVKDFDPSRLFLYYNARSLEGTTNEDSGSTIRDGAKSLNKYGVCHELLWPYNVDRYKQKPFVRCYNEGLTRKSISYQSVAQNMNALKQALANKLPVVVGISVYESFESDEVAKTGIVPMPATSESLLGGHGVKLVGYDDAVQRWRLKNSWGIGWGQEGYFELPYQYLINPNLSGDYWVIKTVK